jgi:DNA-binding beta-propeller fold protein YncE
MRVDSVVRTVRRGSTVADHRARRNRVRRCLALSAASVVLVTVLTPGLSSAVTSLGGWGSPGSGNSQFNRPLGVASFGSGARVYVTDKGNNRIEEFNDKGSFFRSFGPGASSAILEPWAIAVAPKSNGDVYVTSARSGSIFQYTADGVFIRTWRPPSGAGGASTPSGLAVSPVNGDVYLASVTRLERFSAQGTYLSDFPLAAVNNSRSATGVAIAQNGEVFVSSYSNVQVYQSNGQLVRSWGISGTDPGQFKLAVGIAVSERGDVFVLDQGRYGGRVQHFTPEGKLVQSWADDVSFNGPSGIGLSGNGVVFVANTNRNRIETYRY